MDERKKKSSVDQLKVVSEYNKGMGGMDLLDMMLESYQPNLRSNKWWWPLFSNALNITWWLYLKFTRMYVLTTCHI